jgi:hypothetical protein
MTPEELDRATARFQEQLDALPPATDEQIDRIAALFTRIKLRQARDRARARVQADHERAERNHQRDQHLSLFGPDVYSMRRHLAEHGEDADALFDARLRHRELAALHATYHPREEA